MWLCTEQGKCSRLGRMGLQQQLVLHLAIECNCTTRAGLKAMLPVPRWHKQKQRALLVEHAVLHQTDTINENCFYALAAFTQLWHIWMSSPTLISRRGLSHGTVELKASRYISWMKLSSLPQEQGKLNYSSSEMFFKNISPFLELSQQMKVSKTLVHLHEL